MKKAKTICTVLGSAVAGGVLVYFGLKNKETIKTFATESYGKAKSCGTKLINAGKKGVTASKEAFKSETVAETPNITPAE